MSSIAGVGGHSPLAQASARPAAAQPQPKADATALPEHSPGAAAAKALPQAGRVQAKDSKLADKADKTSKPEAPLKPSSKSLGPEMPELAFSSTADALQQRDAADEKAAAVQNTPTASELMQDKMLRQIVKMKQAYSHIQAHTGDSKAGASFNMVV